MSFLGSSHPTEQCPAAYEGDPFDIAKATAEIHAVLGIIPEQDASRLYAWLSFLPDPSNNNHYVDLGVIEVPNNSPYADRLLRLSGKDSAKPDPIARDAVQKIGSLICDKNDVCQGPVNDECPVVTAAAFQEAFLQAGLPTETN